MNNGITKPAGQSDAFVVKLDPTGAKIIYSTYLGSYTAARALAVDTAGSAYITGFVNGIDLHPFPVFPNYAGRAGTYVAKLDAAGAFIYAWYYPWDPEVDPPAGGIAVDSTGSAYVASYMSSPISGVISKLSPDGAKEIYRTNLGPGVPTALAVDTAGSVYVTGYTTSGGSPWFARFKAPWAPVASGRAPMPVPRGRRSKIRPSGACRHSQWTPRTQQFCTPETVRAACSEARMAAAPGPS